MAYNNDTRNSGFLFQGLICTQHTCDFDDCILGCKGKSQVLRCTRELTCASGEPLSGCGCVTDKNNKEFCKIGCLFCAYGCKEPETCCKGAAQICCMKEAVALPFDQEYVAVPTCSYYCLTCLPQCGCCVKAPRIPALEKPVTDYSPVFTKQMDRGMQMPAYRDDVPKGNIV